MTALFAPGALGSSLGPDLEHAPRPLAGALSKALTGWQDLAELDGVEPWDRRDELLALATIHDLHLAPLSVVGSAARWQHHPTIAELKGRLEARFIARLEIAAIEVRTGSSGSRGSRDQGTPADAVESVRALAAVDMVPSVYDWLAEEATLDELCHFVAVEGGPDGGFDDLVALCQVGLDGSAKLELATNYWDEMGRGRMAGVHTGLHQRLSVALSLAPPPREHLPSAALERLLLCSMLATNRWLQPEMVGALGLIELQAGPRCRRIARGLRRVGAPADALPFYDEHAEADPRHGKDWLDKVITPLADSPLTAAGIVRGARWRAAVNRAFYAWTTSIAPTDRRGLRGPNGHSGAEV